MRYLFKLFVWVLILLPLPVLGGIYLCIEDHPLIQRDVRLTPDEVQRAKRLFQEHDPRKLKDGEIKTVSVSQRDLSVALNYLVHLLGRGGSVVTVKDGYLAAQATVKLPTNPFGAYVNVDVGLTQTADFPRFAHLRIGRLEIPKWLADMGFQRGLDSLYANSGHEFASDVIHNVAMNHHRLKVTYQWNSEITEVVRSVLVSEQDQERLKAYNKKLVEVASHSNARAKVSLVNVMQPLFVLARERSKNGDAAKENHAAILVLSAYVNGRGLKRLAPEAENWPQPVRHNVTLRGREDFSQHFMTSAALSMVGGNLISDAIGLFKEVEDSRGGSGFSFADLCADKAGTLFGEQATSTKNASNVQRRLAGSLGEGDLVPVASDLPEHMPGSEFHRRYGGLKSPQYKHMMAKIDRRVAALSLYQEHR